MGLPPETVNRFRADLERLHDPAERLGVAVSGGPDSLALLLLAHAALGNHVFAATVDHGLRAESAAETRFVADLCAKLGVRCEILTVKVAEGNLQAAARDARYDALWAWAERRALGSFATAHHADDQAETVMMRLNRGSGVAGLAGIRGSVRRPGSEVSLIRPLLSWRKRELERVVEEAGIAPVRDPSNAEDRFDRVRMRAELLDADWIDPVAVSRSACHLAEADRLIDQMAFEELNANVEQTGSIIRYRPHGLGRVGGYRLVHARVVAMLIERTGGTARGSEVQRLVDRLTVGDGGSLAGFVACALPGPVWELRPEPPRRSG